MHERPSLMSNNSRTGSLNSEFSIKVVAPGSADDHLINALVKRIFSKLSFGSNPLTDRPEQDEVLRQTTHTLEQLARFRINTIVSELINLLDEVSTRRPSARDGAKIPAPSELVRDALLILKILASCMTSHWEYCKENCPHADVADPGLDHAVAQNTLRISIFYAYQSVEHSEMSDEIGRLYEQNLPPMVKPSMEIIRYISASNWSVCNAVWKSHLQSCSNLEGRMETRPLRMIDNMCMSLDCLTSIIKDVGMFAFLPKRAQDVVAMSLRRTIMSWIDENPKDFARMYSRENAISTHADKLFEVIASLPDSQSRKETLWPVSMTLLLLCPDIIVPAVHAFLHSTSGKHDSNIARISKKLIFLDNVRKCLKIDGLVETAVMCLTDYAKAVFLLPRHENGDLIRYALGTENAVYSLIFDGNSVLYKANRDRARLSQLVLDKLTAIYRADPRQFGEIVLTKAFDPNSNTYVTYNVSKSCRIYHAQKKRKLSLDELGNITELTAPKIRRQLQYLLKTFSPSSPSSGDRPVFKAGALPVDKADLIVEILRTLKEHIPLAISGTKLDDKLSTNDSPSQVDLETAILDFILEESVANRQPEISEAGGDLVEVLYAPENAWRWAEYAKAKRDDGHLFWQYMYPLTFDMAQKLINHNFEREVALQAMQRLHACYSNAITILKANKDLIRQGLYHPDSIDYLKTIESSLLISLCSSNLNISKVAVQLFQQLHEMGQLTLEVCGDEAAAVKPHFEAAERLSQVSFVVSSRLAIQKAFRKALGQIRQPTESITAALGTAFEERERLSKHLSTPPGTRKIIGNRTMDAEAIVADWVNYSGFLASLGGCWYSDAYNEGGTPRARPDSLIKSEIDSKQRLKAFLKDQCRYLASESSILRETVSRMLSTDLSPRLFGLLFEQLDDITSKLFDTKGQPVCKDNNTLFVDQAVILLRGLVDRITEPVDIPQYVDFGGILQSFCEYLERLGGEPVKMQIKAKMCLLCELVAGKRDVLNLKQEVRVMNNLLSYVHRWAAEGINLHSKGDPFASESFNTFQRYALRAMANITQHLPLLVQSEPDTDPSEAKSKLFKSYFEYFTWVLKKCRIMDNLDADRRPLNVNKDLAVLLQKSKEHVKDLGPLRDLAITTISNLVNANLESGLPYCLPMACSDDVRARTSFLYLFTRMLEQRVDFEDLDDALPLDRNERIVEMLTSDTAFGLAISTACPANYVDTLSPALLHVYGAKGLTVRFVKNLVEHEINRTESHSVLFRGNNAAPRIITSFLHTQVESYLADTLGPIMKEVIRDPRLQDFSTGGNLSLEEREANLRYIQVIAKKFLDAIVNSAETLPVALKEIFHHIAVCAAARFPGNATAPHMGVGSIVFLRFIGPAISIPSSSMLVNETLGVGVKRALVLVTKIIQSLASNAMFTEQNLLPLNPFLEANIKRVLEFVRSISALSVSSEPTTPSIRIAEASDPDVVRLYDFMYNNLADVKKALYQIRMPQDEPDAPRNRAQILTTITTQLGSSIRRDASNGHEGNPVQISASVSIEDYHEFMEKCKGRNIDAFNTAGIFYLAGVSRQHRPVLCYVARRFDFKSMDVESFTYYICHVLESVWANPFEIFIDVTAQTSANELPPEWVTNLLRGLPRSRVENCALIYHYNVNTPYRRQIRTIFRNAKQLGFEMESRSRFLRGLDDVQRFLDLTDVHLSDNTIALDMQSALVFEPVWRILTRDKRASVSIKVGQESVQVIYSEEQQVTSTSNTPLCDVIFATDIDEVNVSSYVSDENEFVLKGKGIRLVFSSPKRHDIIQAIQSVRASTQYKNPLPITQKGVRSSSLPGTLLNAVFLSLPSEDQLLRQSAWHLLCAISKAYHIEADSPLRPAPGLYLPPHNLDSLVGLSLQMSQKSPHLSLDIIGAFLERFKEYTDREREYGLMYIQPWIPQLEVHLRLGSDDYNEISKEVKAVLHMFIHYTYEKSQMTWYTHIWPSVGKVHDLAKLLLSELYHYAIDFGFGSMQTDTAARILLACKTTELQGHVISRLRESIQKIIPKPAKALVDHPAWKEVAVQLRLCLTHSFDNWQLSHQYLPEIMYIISVTAACGPAVIRSSTHAFLVNTVHSIITHYPLPPNDHQKLETILNELSTAKYTLLFGLSHTIQDTAFSASANSANDAVEALSISGLETIVTLLIDVINIATSNSMVVTSSLLMRDQSNVWRARWLSLVTGGAFRSNPAIQPRLLVALGCLAESEVDDALLYQLVNALHNTLDEHYSRDGNEIVLNSLLFACTKLVGARLKPNYKGPDSAYLHELFWLATAVLEIVDTQTYPLAVTFVETCLKALSAADDDLEHHHLPTYFLTHRKALKPAVDVLDQLVGVNFERSFSFSMAALLAKGLKSQSSREIVKSTTAVLFALSSKQQRSKVNDAANGLELVKPTISFEVLPYLAILVPIISTSDELADYLALAGLDGDEFRSLPLAEVWRKLFNDGSVEEMLDNETSLLLLSLTAAILSSCEREKELLLLYTFFAEAAPNTRSTFPYIYDEMIPRMAETLSTSNSVPLLSTIESILCTATSDPEFGADGVANYTHGKLLEELGFSILARGRLEEASKELKAQVFLRAAEVAESVLAVWKGATLTPSLSS